MKQTENNEMDLLIRGLARRDGATPLATEDHSAMHLDADELNSYAEQSLPAAARARYTSHLAECASCRKIVSQLTSASGAHVSEPSVSQQASGLRQMLAAFFSPGFMRFAVPALALLAFITVGLVALRKQTQPEFVAVNQPEASRDRIQETKEVTSPAETRDSAGASEERRSTQSDPGADKLQKPKEKNETSNLATTTDSVSVASDRDISLGRAAGAVAQPSYAPEPSAAPPPKPQISSAEAPTQVAARQKEEADKKDERPREQEVARDRRYDNQNQVSSPQGQGSLARKSAEKVRAPDEKRVSEVGAKTNDDQAEIRNVSGRRFRRQGTIWIDTSYQSSTATTTVARGSEQFRALVADEPGIRAIAAQLSGEVIVVWKGRAYRIR